MTKNQEDNAGMLGSKFWRTTLVIVAAALIFGGPTYLVYALINILKASYTASMGSGLVMLALGLLLMGYLIRKKVIT